MSSLSLRPALVALLASGLVLAAAIWFGELRDRERRREQLRELEAAACAADLSEAALEQVRGLLFRAVVTDPCQQQVIRLGLPAPVQRWYAVAQRGDQGRSTDCRGIDEADWEAAAGWAEATRAPECRAERRGNHFVVQRELEVEGDRLVVVAFRYVGD